MKIRIIFAIICFVISIILCFVISPLISKQINNETNIVILKNDLEEGHQITKDDYYIEKIFSKNIPKEYITTEADILNKYTLSYLHKNTFVSKNDITSDNPISHSTLYTLKDDECAFSIPINSLSSGVGNNLKVGDIISVIVNMNGESFIPNELTNIQVLSLTSSNGKTNDETSTYSCITLCLKDDQATLLSKYLKTGNISIILKNKTSN